MIKYLSTTIIMGSICLAFYTMIELKTQKKQTELYKELADSLQMELFIEHTIADRHDLTREAVLTKYPKIYAEYNEFLETQTE